MKRIKAVTVAAVTAALALSMSACVKSSDTTANAGASGSGSAPQSPRVCRFETAFQIGSQVEPRLQSNRTFP